MGCGKSKHDVVTGNTRTVRKPLEAESVKGKQNETIKKQESCQCQKSTDVAAAVSADQPDTTLENITKKPKEKEAEVDCGEKSEEKKAGEHEHKAEEKETTILPPKNIVTEETSKDVNENVLIVDKQNEEGDIETVVEDEKSIDDRIPSDADTEISPPEIEELKPDVQTPVTTESEVQDTLTTENVAIENVETASTENYEVPVLKDENEVDHVQENLAKEVESA
ncbi:Kinase-like protein [Hirschfeldia incana]|nr:Kinase-like protein [Hirschfeldia incana]